MKSVLLKISLVFALALMPMVFAHAAKPIKILLVPGHDNETWGAQYGNTKEADMNLNLATKIYNTLKKDKRFEVHITRKAGGQAGGYAKEFADYFSKQKDKIVEFRENAKKKMQEKISDGNFIQKENPPHNNASEDMSVKLYGFNKWANENQMDAVIHIHFNDYPRPDKWTAGKYKGFAIYMPEEQMANSKGSAKLAEKIFTQLKKKYETSTYEKEKEGLVPDQSLIALGSNGTLKTSVRSMLIEYGYIYRFKTDSLEKNYTSMASLTATGIKNYFFPKK
jgi:N-acetylmuramoyl-L-alanine amidase